MIRPRTRWSVFSVVLLSLVGTTLAVDSADASLTARKTVVVNGPTELGSTATVSSRFQNDTGRREVLLNTEVADGTGQKIGQWYEALTLETGSSVDRSYQWDTGGLKAGEYHFRQGIFSPDWAQTLWWEDSAGSVRLTGHQWALEAAVDVEVNTVTIESSFFAGATGTFTFDTEVYDSQNAQVAQGFFIRAASAGSTFTDSHQWQLPAGEYTVRQGVFAGSWGDLLRWSEPGTSFTVAAPAEQPQAEQSEVAQPRPKLSQTQSAAPDLSNRPKPPIFQAPTNSANPLTGAGFYGNHPNARQQAAAWRSTRPKEAALMEKMASVPTATWFGNWNANVRADVSATVRAAEAQGKVPVLVAYNIPDRDCGGHSGGGLGSEHAYRGWIHDFAAGIGNAKAVVVLEPDALGLSCGDANVRYRSLNAGVDALARTGAVTYLDASSWLSPAETASRLRKAGVHRAQGFALNTSNFKPTSFNTNYGESVSGLLGGSRYVVDISRNGGRVTGDAWCNPSNAALGAWPTTNTGAPHADAFLWTKPPGASDGNCNGGPSAGQWWPEYAIDLARAAGW